jgi:hypothetical protein
MQIKEIIAKAQTSEEYKKFHKEQPDAYLTHVFFMDDGKGIGAYDVGFYSKKAQKIASFEVTDSGVCLKDLSEPFREPGKEIDKLDMAKVKITPEDAIETAKALQKEKYPQSIPTKRIVILQNFNKHHIWNITYVTMKFETLNIKVDAETGKISYDNVQKIFDFAK